MTTGTVLRDSRLAKIGVVSEFIGLLCCVAVGAVAALVAVGINGTAALEWPTDEMASRGHYPALLTGVAIAVPSGVGVALSVLGNNQSSLVGVAISASLLPPAVNAGMCWVYAVFDKRARDEFVSRGLVSLILTLVNIGCIWLTAMTVFWFKEVTYGASAIATAARQLTPLRAAQTTPPPPPPSGSAT